MYRSLMTIIREFYLYLTNVIFMLQQFEKLRRYILCGEKTACRRAA